MNPNKIVGLLLAAKGTKEVILCELQKCSLTLWMDVEDYISKDSTGINIVTMNAAQGYPQGGVLS